MINVTKSKYSTAFTPYECKYGIFEINVLIIFDFDFSLVETHNPLMKSIVLFLKVFEFFLIQKSQ